MSSRSIVEEKQGGGRRPWHVMCTKGGGGRTQLSTLAMVAKGQGDGTVSAWVRAASSHQVEYKNAQGRVYWYHPGERKSVWDKPNELKSARERAMDTTPWREYKSGDRSYYVNKETKESTWKIPADLQAFLDTIPDEPAPATAARPSKSMSPALSPATPPRGATPTHEAVGTAALRQQTSSVTRHATPVYATQEEAEAAFQSLLQRKNVNASSTWEQTLREIITEPLYKALRTLAERKAVFHRYVDELKAQQAARREQKSAELRPKMLRAVPDLKPYASYATFKKKLGTHPLWSELEDEEQAVSIFEAIRQDLREKEAARQKARGEQRRAQFLALLQKIEIRPTTRWKDVQPQAPVADMPLTEQLRVFEDHMARVEADEREQQQGHGHSRQDRKARDAFRSLLEERIKEGTLHARSTWASFFPMIREDERLLNMTRVSSGSSAQDLFYDALDALEREFAGYMRSVQTSMREHQTLAREAADWDAWKETVQESDMIRALPEHTLRALFDECVYQSERDTRDMRRRTERRLRHYADDLRYAFRHVEPPLDIHASFEEVLPRIRMLPEYMALERAGDDETNTTARAAWDRYVRRQTEKLADAMYAPGRSRTDYTDLDDAGEERKRKEPPEFPDPRAVRRRTEYET